MNTETILKGAEKLHAEAAGIDSAYKYLGVTYRIKFDGHNFVVTAGDDSNFFPLTYNTRKLSTAKQWLREWLAN